MIRRGSQKRIALANESRIVTGSIAADCTQISVPHKSANRRQVNVLDLAIIPQGSTLHETTHRARDIAVNLYSLLRKENSGSQSAGVGRLRRSLFRKNI